MGHEAAFRLITAFSRDQKDKKIYVQDRLRENAEAVFEMVYKRNAVVVVCGSAGAMPKAVRKALVDVLVEQGKKERGTGMSKIITDNAGAPERDGGWTQERAEQYLDGMEKSRRYLQETW